MTELNLDLQGLYVVEDTDNYYIGIDATASSWGMAYGIHIDTDLVDGSGAASDPWGRAANTVSTHLPKHTLYVWHDGGDWLQDVQLNHWDGSAWSYDSLISQGSGLGFGPDSDWVEYRVPKAPVGDPTPVALEAFTTGGNGHAQDTVPSDPNVSNTEPDWGPDVTILSAFALFPPAPPVVWYVRGDFNGWGTDDPTYDDGTPGDGIYTALVTVPAAGQHEFKVAVEDWSTSYPSSGHSWLDTGSDGQVVTVTFATNLRPDGWLPETNSIGVSTEPGAWTAIGDWQGWNNGDPSTAMTAVSGWVYEPATTIASPGSHQYTAVKSGTWDAVGADGRSVNANTTAFDTTIAGRVQVVVEPVPPVPGHDNDVWWDRLGHNSRHDLYGVPSGAVTTGTPVTIRFRTYQDDVTEVTLRVWNTAAGAQTLLPMEIVAGTDDPPFGYDFWQATLPAQDQPTTLYYRFIVRDGTDQDFYEDDDLFDGGWGVAYDESPDYSFQVDVNLPDFETPEWMKNAVIYQIYPDRFLNGNRNNDPEPTDPSVYGNPVLVKAWDELPEGYCRAYEGMPCDEGPLGRDFYGGDFKGIWQKLDYLQSLGVTALYLNPVFKAPSNHGYDTTDYFHTDPYFGTCQTFQRLLSDAQAHGIRDILDGVFNHTSSDSLYFDKYSRCPKDGAYESQTTRTCDWYTFYEWPDSYNSWWGFDTLPVLTEIQEVRDYIYADSRSVARRWLNFGASGWRLDVAPDKSHDWWQEYRPSVKSVSSDAAIIGEIWDDASPWLLGNEFESTVNYRFRRALLGFINGDTVGHNQGFVRDLNPDQFSSMLQSIQEDYPAPAFAALMNLVDSHDMQRILWTLTPGARNREDKEFNPANLAEGKTKQKLLAILQVALPGAPTVYYGGEVGLSGDTDPDDRRPFPWDNQDAGMLAHYRALTALRGSHSVLRTGSFVPLWAHNADGTYAYGCKDESGAAVVAVNKDTVEHTVVIDVSGYIPEGTALTDALNGGNYIVSGGLVWFGMPACWGAILITPEGTDLTPPPAPASLVAIAGDGTVDLGWDPTPDAAGYTVYPSPASGGGYSRLNDVPVTGTSCSDSTVANGRRYYYTVTAVDEAGNESARSSEAAALPALVIGWASLQWPPSLEHVISVLNPTDWISGQVWIDGHTYLPGPTEGLMAQVGCGPDGSNPDGNPDWVWVDAVLNVDAGNNDEFKGQLLPEAVGAFDYAYRCSTTAGMTWLYADLKGTGDGYDPAQAGALAVVPSADLIPPTVPANLHLVEASPSFIHMAWDPVGDPDLYRYEIYHGDASGGPYAKMANVPAPIAEYADWNVASGSTDYYVVLAVDTSFNKSGYSNELAASAAARPVRVTFNAALPACTPRVGDPTGDIYMGGSVNGWNSCGTLMTRADLLASVTLTFREGHHLGHKYTRGSWDYVEKGAGCEEIANRAATVVYGSDGTMQVDDTVPNWRNTPPCEP